MGDKSFLRSVVSIGASIAALALFASNPFLAAAIVIGGMLITSTILADSPTEIPDFDAGAKFNARSTKAPLKVLYGQRKIGGNDVYIHTGGSKNKTLYIVTTLCEGECEGIVSSDISDDDPDKGTAEEFFIGDRRYDDFAGRITFTFHNGASAQAVDSDLKSFTEDRLADGKITADEVWDEPLKLTCYVVQKFIYDDKQFLGYPTPRTFTVKGLKIRDIRDQSIAYSNNPALCLYDYLTNTRYGMGIDISKVDQQSFADAADYCDFKNWTLNMIFGDEANAQQIIDIILFHFRGVLIWREGQIFVRFAELKTIHANTNVKTIEDKHIVQDVTGVGLISISEASQFSTPDALRVKYIDPENDYIEDSILIGEDNGVVNDISYPGCTDRQMAMDLGTYYLERNNLNRSVVMTGRDDLISLEPNDVVTLNSTALSFVDQLMRVKSVTADQSGLVNLGLIQESVDLYDDDFNITAETVLPNSGLFDPTEEPPSATAVLSETKVTVRLRSTTTLKATLTLPATYPWLEHIEVWVAITALDESTPSTADYKRSYTVTESFDIPNAEEGRIYYIRLVSVSIWGVTQTLADATTYSRTIVGKTDTAPVSLDSVSSSPNDNAINLFADVVDDGDVEVYEYRLGVAGGTWSSSVFLSALRNPNLSLKGIKPGTHLFFANTLSNNGIYGDTPVSETVTLIDPPDNWTIQNTTTIINLIINPDMEDNSNWSPLNTPVSDGQSNEQAHAGTFSWKFVTDEEGGDQGIFSDNFTTATGDSYGCTLWVYPDDTTSVGIDVRQGDGVGNAYTATHTSLIENEWNEISFFYTESSGGGSARLEIYDADETDATYYVDDVAFIEGTFSNTFPTLSGGELFIKTNGALTGTWITETIDRGSSLREMSYIFANIEITGTGTTWDDKFPIPTTWDEGNVSTLTWNQIFELPASPQVVMSILHSPTTDPPTIETKRMEILSTIQTARYYRIKYTITDPNINVKALIGEPTIKFLT